MWESWCYTCTTLEYLAYCQNVVSLRYSYRCLSELVELPPLPYYCEQSTYNANTFIYLMSPFWDIIRISILIVSFVPLVDFVTLCLQNAFI